MVLGLGAEKEIFAIGGVAKNAAVIKTLEEKLGIETAKLELDSQIVASPGPPRAPGVATLCRGWAR